MTNIVNRPKGLPIVGNMFQFASGRHKFLLDVSTNHGEAAQFKIMNFNLHILSNPEHVKDFFVKKKSHFVKADRSRDNLRHLTGDGLLTSIGDYHMQQRKMVQPALHATRIHGYADTMVDIAENMLATWDIGSERDIHQDMMLITMEIVSRTLFGSDVLDDAIAVGEAMMVLQEGAQRRFIPIFELPEWIETPERKKLNEARATIDRVVMKFIKERRAEGDSDKGDLLSMLLLSEDENGNRMNDKEVRDEAVTLFSAGHETTSNALTWALYLISQHPDVEAKLQQEVDTVLAGRRPTLMDLRELPYTNMIIKETLRLYPPAWTLMVRQIIEDVTLGDYHLPKGNAVIVSPYVLHHHPNLWDNPEAFDPERFSPENEKNHHKYQYIPFGGGEHVCIGNSYAMMEAALVLATIAQKYHLRLLPNAEVNDRALITLVPENGLPMRVLEREFVPEMV
ncbi:MAG: cytochrome P450 [Phototrophicaceae bacterium]